MRWLVLQSQPGTGLGPQPHLPQIAGNTCAQLTPLSRYIHSMCCSYALFWNATWCRALWWVWSGSANQRPSGATETAHRALDLSSETDKKYWHNLSGKPFFPLLTPFCHLCSSSFSVRDRVMDNCPLNFWTFWTCLGEWHFIQHISTSIWTEKYPYKRS